MTLKAAQSRLVYESEPATGTGAFRRVARKPLPAQVPAAPPVDLEQSRDWIGAQKLLDDGLDWDYNLDSVMSGLKIIHRYLETHESDRQRDGEMTRELKRAALIPERPGERTGWRAKKTPGATRAEHGRYVKELHRFATESALSMLFREQRNHPGLETAKALVDFMDERHKAGLPPPEARAALGGLERQRYRWNGAFTDWPFDWTAPQDQPALLAYMIDRRSCLLLPALHKVDELVEAYFPNRYGHYSDRQKPIMIDEFSARASNPAIMAVPGALRAQVVRITMSETERPVREAAQAALRKIDSLMQHHFGQVEWARRNLRQKTRALKAIWGSPSPDSL